MFTSPLRDADPPFENGLASKPPADHEIKRAIQALIDERLTFLEKAVANWKQGEAFPRGIIVTNLSDEGDLEATDRGVLTRPAYLVTDFPQAERIANLLETIATRAHLFGLAAPQVGIPLQLAVCEAVKTPAVLRQNLDKIEEEGRDLRVYINPSISRLSQDCVCAPEACASVLQEVDGVPQYLVAATVTPKYYTVEYNDLKGYRRIEVMNAVTKDAAGKTVHLANPGALFHELAHLAGQLFTAPEARPRWVDIEGGLIQVGDRKATTWDAYKKTAALQDPERWVRYQGAYPDGARAACQLLFSTQSLA